jgi:hypothetical protein
MNMPLSQQPPTFKLSKLFWIGIVILTVGSGPLLLTILFASLGFTRDPNPNPIGFGIMALLTFWPSIGLILAGLGQSFKRYREAKRKFAWQQAK